MGQDFKRTLGRVANKKTGLAQELWFTIQDQLPQILEDRGSSLRFPTQKKGQSELKLQLEFNSKTVAVFLWQINRIKKQGELVVSSSSEWISQILELIDAISQQWELVFEPVSKNYSLAEENLIHLGGNLFEFSRTWSPDDFVLAEFVYFSTQYGERLYFHEIDKENFACDGLSFVSISDIGSIRKADIEEVPLREDE